MQGNRVAVAQAGHSKTQRHFVAHRRMPADYRRPGMGHYIGRHGHDLGQRAPLQVGRHARQDDRGGRRLRGSAHRPDIAQRMHRGNPGHQRRVGGYGAQMVGADDLPRGSGQQNRRIIARPVAQNRPQRAAPDLGPATAAQRFVP